MSKKKRVRRKTTYDRASTNIIGNFRGVEDMFWKKVVSGFKKLLSSAFTTSK